jgi:two-component system, sporulation sensor kinase E
MRIITEQNHTEKPERTILRIGLSEKVRSCFHDLPKNFSWNIIDISNFESLANLDELKHIDICCVNDQVVSNTRDILNDKLSNVPTILFTENEDLFEYSSDRFIKHLNIEQLTTSTIENTLFHAIAFLDQKRQLKIQNERYKKLFQHSIDAVFIADENFKLIEYNDAFAKLFKIDFDHELSIRDLFYDYKQFEELLDLTKKYGKNKVIKVQMINAVKELFVVNFKLSRVHENFDGVSTYYQGVVEDVSDLEIAQLRLIETEKMNYSGKMARLIGHEVRNPLTNIFLATSELKDEIGGFSEDSAILFEMIKRNSTRIKDLIDNLLHSTSIVEVNKKRTDLCKIIKDAIDLCKDRIMLREINLVFHGLENEIFLDLDREKFKIAIANIMINATEAMAETENPQLFIDLKQHNSDLTLEITDNGCGMDESTLQNIYNPFYTKKETGFGLGLTHVKNILLQHDCLLQAKSELGVGTTFSVKINQPTLN